MQRNTESFTDGRPRLATELECVTRWSAGRPGENFRCYFCGYKFHVGDYWRWQHTNDIPDAAGNPIVCMTCDDEPEKVRKKWKEKCAEFRSDKWWWFNKV